MIVSQHPGSPDTSDLHLEDDAGDILHATLHTATTANSSSNSNDSSDDEEAALTRPIIAGKAIDILIDKGQTGLGLSIVGGSDTLLVCATPLLAFSTIAA